MGNSKTVVIAEKPNTARKIQAAIGGEPGVVVVPARGHVIDIQYPKELMTGKWRYPVIEMPRDMVYAPDASSGDVLERIVNECKGCDTLVSATDLDREGSAIFMEILFYLQKTLGARFRPELKRMCYSSLTPAELKKAWASLEPLDEGRAFAGLTRNIQDMQWGINLTRGLTLAAQRFAKSDVVSSGRVQTPMLKLIYGRDLEIDKFEPKEYYTLKLICAADDGDEFETLYQGKITSQDQLMSIIGDVMVGGKYTVTVNDSEQRTPPPPPFNGTDLQVEGNRVLGFSAKQIADRQNGLAQALYMAGMVSYPGTDSQKYPPDWEQNDYDTFKTLLNNILGGGNDKLFTRKAFVEGKKTDDAHPCIRPMAVGTGEGNGNGNNDFPPDAWKLFELISRRCAAGACEDSIVNVKNVFVEVENTGEPKKKHVFKGTGKSYKQKGWLEAYPYNIKDDKLVPALKTGDTVTAKKTTNEKKLTKPPPRYNTVSLIAQCDKLGLGTKNTRPAMVEKLARRGFVEITSHGKKEILTTTELAARVITTLDKYAPVIIDKQLTEKFNSTMDRIEKAPAKFHEMNIQMLDDLLAIMDKFKQDEALIGAGIADCDPEAFVKCGECGKLMTKYESKDDLKVNFYGCSGYPECDHKLFYHSSEQVKFGITCKACGAPCASGRLSEKGREYLRCMADCDGTPMRCAQCGAGVFVGRSKKGEKKLYSLCRPCSVFNRFKLDLSKINSK